MLSELEIQVLRFIADCTRGRALTTEIIKEFFYDNSTAWLSSRALGLSLRNQGLITLSFFGVWTITTVGRQQVASKERRAQ